MVVDRSMFEITMRRFYVGQVTKYNLEQWYHPLEAKATALGPHHKGTSVCGVRACVYVRCVCGVCASACRVVL